MPVRTRILRCRPCALCRRAAQSTPGSHRRPTLASSRARCGRPSSAGRGRETHDVAGAGMTKSAPPRAVTTPAATAASDSTREDVLRDRATAQVLREYLARRSL